MYPAYVQYNTKKHNYFMNYPQYLWNLTLDILFPVRCVECGQFSTGSKKDYLCKECSKQIPIKQGFECIGCKSRTSAGLTCFNCKDTNPLDQLLVVSDYNNPTVVKLIKLLKYRFIKEAIKPIANTIKTYIYLLNKQKKINLIAERSLITFVPMRQRRTNWRGFNQAELIANSIANILQQKVRTDVVEKIKDLEPQAEINERNERLMKIRGSFMVLDSKSILDQTVLLVDDICTTGGTLNECARVLKEGGAKKVIGFVFARG